MANRSPLFVDDGNKVSVDDTIAIPESAAAVVPSNTTVFTQNVTCLYVGVQGDLAVEMLTGEQVVLAGIMGWVPIKVRKVLATATTADAIVRFW